MRNRFTNPANGDFYDWVLNHSDEEESGHTTTVNRTANTGGTGLVRQQGDDGPWLLRYTGTILDRSQHQAMMRWKQISRGQTIYFKDYDGQEYEVVINQYTARRVRVLRNRRDPSMPFHRFEYTIEMEVVRFIAGDAVVAGVTP